MTSRVLSTIHRGWLLGLLPSVFRFERALRDPAGAQASLLLRRLRDNAGTAYGRAHGFERIRSVGELQRRVPVVDYDALEPWIARVARAEPGVLTAGPVRMMERSGGSTTADKLVPYTQDLLDDFSSATNPWLHDLYTTTPGLVGSRSYWSISPVAQGARRTQGGVPIGIEDDTEYFGPVGRWALSRTMAVPSSVAACADLGAWRRETLRHLLSAADLGLISVWSPTFLTTLMTALGAELDERLAELPARRRDEVRRGLDRAGSLVGEAIWPRLALISCWTDGIAAEFLPALRRFFPRTAIQGKGLLATEGVVSLPYGASPDPVLAVASHFLEFIDLAHPSMPPRLAHELRPGGEYSPLLTTGGGLYRYHLKDVIACVGVCRATPRVRFLGKLDRVSDLCGEKINAKQVDAALLGLSRREGMRWDFALVAPVRTDGRGPDHYCLFVESPADDAVLAAMAAAVEEHLSAGHPYRYARELGQLGPMRVQRVEGGAAAYQAALVRAGQRAGDIKPTHLDARRIWGDTFGPGTPVHAEGGA